MIVIHFTDQVSRVTPEELAKDCGVPVAEVDNAIEDLLARGLLVRRDDGDFDAAIPDDEEGTA